MDQTKSILVFQVVVVSQQICRVSMFVAFCALRMVRQVSIVSVSIKISEMLDLSDHELTTRRLARRVWASWLIISTRFFLDVNSFVLIIYSCSGRPAQILIPSTAFTFVCRNWNINANLLTNIRAQLILTKQFTYYINESLPYSWTHGSSIYSTIYLLE